MNVQRLIVGLGNPGADYVRTRHNVGFDVVDLLAERFGVGLSSSACRAAFGTTRLPAGDLSEQGERTADGATSRGRLGLAKPMTYMNRSGHAVRCLVEEHGIPLDGVLVVYDEVALPLGELRLRPSGSPGGHRGMESVVYNLRSSEIARLRCGIGPKPDGEDLSEFVLRPFDERDLASARALVERAARCAEYWLEAGSQATMNRFNGPAPTTDSRTGEASV